MGRRGRTGTGRKAKRPSKPLFSLCLCHCSAFSRTSLAFYRTAFFFVAMRKKKGYDDPTMAENPPSAAQTLPGVHAPGSTAHAVRQLVDKRHKHMSARWYMDATQVTSDDNSSQACVSSRSKGAWVEKGVNSHVSKCFTSAPTRPISPYTRGHIGTTRTLADAQLRHAPWPHRTLTLTLTLTRTHTLPLLASYQLKASHTDHFVSLPGHRYLSPISFVAYPLRPYRPKARSATGRSMK